MLPPVRTATICSVAGVRGPTALRAVVMLRRSHDAGGLRICLGEHVRRGGELPDLKDVLFTNRSDTVAQYYASSHSRYSKVALWLGHRISHNRDYLRDPSENSNDGAFSRKPASAIQAPDH